MATREIDLLPNMIEQIASGKKNLIIETLPSDADDASVKVGDILVIGRGTRRWVKAVRRYGSLVIMVHNEDHRQIIPNLTRTQVLKRLQSHFSAEEQERGIVVYEIEQLLRLVPKKRK